MQRRRVLRLISAGALGIAHVGQASVQQSPLNCAQSHTGWVADALERMLTIKAGMTRETLLTVFTTEGGIYTPLQRTYVSRDCQYFKVNVEFKAVGRPERDEDGRLSMVEGDDDVITKITGPYLQFVIMD